MASTPSGQPDRTKPTTTRKLRVVAKTRCFRVGLIDDTVDLRQQAKWRSFESVRASRFVQRPIRKLLSSS
ncbi:hypothetical protein FCV25MIE_12081 [Fagus crenata]